MQLRLFDIETIPHLRGLVCPICVKIREYNKLLDLGTRYLCYTCGFNSRNPDWIINNSTPVVP